MVGLLPAFTPIPPPSHSHMAPDDLTSGSQTSLNVLLYCPLGSPMDLKPVLQQRPHISITARETTARSVSSAKIYDCMNDRHKTTALPDEWPSTLNDEL